MKTGSTAIVLGYGSIGRRHALVLERLCASLAIVDVKESACDQAAGEHPSALVFGGLEDLARSGRIDWSSAVAVIATWGPLHASQFKWLVERGVKRILCEKPLASSVRAANLMCMLAAKDSVRLSVNQYVRYSCLAESLEAFAEQHELGTPVSVVVAGGAACLVTNGIHWIDLVSRLFQASPQAVYSTARGDRINPRSPELEFYGGSAIWTFANGREAVFSLTNHSSVAARCRVYYRNATVEFYDDLKTLILNRNMDSVQKYPAITRTGPVSEPLFDGLLPGVAEFMKCMEAALSELVEGEGDMRCPGDVGFAALSAVIGALVSGREKRPVALPIDPESQLGGEEWPIS